MAVVATIIFAVAVAAFARIPLLPDIGSDLSLTAGEIGLLTTAFGLGRLLTDLPAGRLADAVVPTVGLTGAGLLLALSCAVLASAEAFAVALGASALIGCASALTNTTGMYVFATAADAHRRGAGMAIYVTALMSGQVDAIVRRDYPMIQGIVVMATLLVLFCNLLVDLAYGYLNPKVRVR